MPGVGAAAAAPEPPAVAAVPAALAEPVRRVGVRFVGLVSLAEPVRRVGVRFVGLVSVASLGLWAPFFTPIQVLLPEQLEAIDPVNKVLVQPIRIVR
jgi:hypothetical protein